MTRFEDRLAADREVRGAARGLFTQRLDQVRSNLAERSLLSRVKHQAQEKAFDAADYAIDIANENKAIVAATGGALVLWILRKPIFSLMAEWFGKDAVQDDPATRASDEVKEHAG